MLYATQDPMKLWIFVLLLWWVFIVYFLCTFFPQRVTPEYAGNQAEFSLLALLAEVVTSRFVGRLRFVPVLGTVLWMKFLE